MSSVVLRSLRYKIRELTALEITVAIATPFTVMCSTITKNKFKITFRMPEAASAISGIFVSPTLRKMAASKLYKRITGMPSR